MQATLFLYTHAMLSFDFRMNNARCVYCMLQLYFEVSTELYAHTIVLIVSSATLPIYTLFIQVQQGLVESNGRHISPDSIAVAL